MAQPRYLPLVLLFAAAAAAGCGDDAASPACDDDTRIDCICEDSGARGHVACDDGVLGACVCDGPDGGDGCVDDVQCDDGAFCNGQERCLPDSPDADDRGCVHGMFMPFCEDDLDCTIDRCSDQLNRCVHEPADADDDGHFDATCLDADGKPLGDDCDDDDPLAFPGNFEVCDEDDRDEDCNPATFGDKDADGDGAIDIECCNGDTCGDDCDDSLIARRPLQPEFCDEVDNDCDGTVDEEAAEVPWYSDGDGDGFGTGDDVEMSCIPIPGRSLLDTDCQDTNAQRHPGQLEICDFYDNNCNEVADEGAECGVPLGYPVGEAGGAVGGGGTAGGGGSGSMTMDGGVPDAGTSDGGMSTMDAGLDAGGDAGAPLPDLMDCPTRDTTGATQVSGTISTPTIWSGTLHMTGSVQVTDDLTIMPGTHIIADPGTVLHIAWNNNTMQLNANGTEEAPITMCGKAEIAGYWDGLHIDSMTDPASSVSWVLVADAGPSTAGLRVEAAVPLSDVHVTNAVEAGIEAWDFGPGSERFVSSGNGTPLALMDDAAVTRLPSNSQWTGNTVDHVELRDTRFTTAVDIHDPGVPYHFGQGLQMTGDVVVTIDPGVEIEMGADTLFEVGYNNATLRLEANGTPADPILIRGEASAPSSWQGMVIQQAVRSTSYMRHVTVRDAGFGVAALRVRAGVTFDNVTLDNNTGPALDLEGIGLHPNSTTVTIANTDGTAALIHGDAMTKLGDSVTLTSNTENWIEVKQSTHLQTSGTIRDHGVPYYLPFGSTTRNGADITVNAGVEFVMGSNTLFEIGWNNSALTFTADGTASEPIVFRHEANTMGGWEGVELSPNVNVASSFDHVHFLDGGSAGFGNLYIRMSGTLPAANLTNCTFDNGSAYGIYLSTDYGVDYSGNNNSFGTNTSGDINTP